MSIPAELNYTPCFVWLCFVVVVTLTMGSTKHAQDLIGDMNLIENPATGRTLAKGEEGAVFESVKAASDVYAPVSGEVIAANGDVESSPESVNKDAYSAWMFKLKPTDAGDVAELLDAAAYQKLVESEAH